MALVQKDLFPGRGDQLLTLDTATGFEWLNLTATANLSYLGVLAGFGGFVGSFGFKFATSNQVGALYKHAGVSKLGGLQAGLDYANHYGIQVLQDLMNGKIMTPLTGGTGTVVVATNAMVKYAGTGIPSQISPIEVMQTHLNHNDPEKSYTDIGAMTQKAGQRSPRVGSYLVR
jgi:hypothetical protein